jgi:hypothetical protein
MLDTPVFSTLIPSGCGCIILARLGLTDAVVADFASAATFVYGFCTILVETASGAAFFDSDNSSDTSENDSVCPRTIGFSTSGCVYE